MKALNKQALRQKAVKAGGEEWQSRKEPGIGGEYTVIVKGSLVKHPGWSTHRPVADEIVDKKTMDFIAAANPATVLALLDELEAAEKRIAELEAKLANPVLLPKTNGYWNEQEKAHEEAITLAKRQIRLAGFRCEGDE